jgi:putative membrane protein
MFLRLSAAIAAISLLSGTAFAQGAKPTDPQIAHIAYTAGVIDIAAAKQALAKTSNKDVKAFAEDMVRDHEAVNKQALDLVKKLNVTPEDNDTSKTLSKNAADKLAELGKLKGADRQGLCRQRGRLSQGGRQRAGDDTYSFRKQCGAEEPAADGPEDFPGP